MNANLLQVLPKCPRIECQQLDVLATDFELFKAMFLDSTICCPQCGVARPWILGRLMAGRKPAPKNTRKLVYVYIYVYTYVDNWWAIEARLDLPIKYLLESQHFKPTGRWEVTLGEATRKWLEKWL